MAEVGIFGPDAAEVRRQISQEGRQQDIDYASLPAGRVGVAVAGQAGRMLGTGASQMMGYQDPREAKAALLQEAQQEVAQAGVSLMENPSAYYKVAYAALAKRGLMDEAMQVRGIALQDEQAKAQTGLTKAQTRQAAATGSRDVYSTPDGTLYRGSTGEVLREGVPDAGTSNLITLAPKGTTTKGAGNEQTFDRSDPARKAMAQALMNEGWVDTSKLPSPDNNTAMETMAEAVGGMAAATKEMAIARQAGKEVAEADAKIYAEAKTYGNISNQIKNIRVSLEEGKSDFGTLSEARRGITSFVKIFVPAAAPVAEDLLKMDTLEFDNVERSSELILAEMASMYSGGSRMTAAALQTLKNAGPGTFLTNEGLNVVTRLMEKRATYAYDYALFTASLPEGANRELEKLKWAKEHSDDPKYFLSGADLKEAKIAAQKSRSLREYKRKSSPMPTYVAKDGREKADQNLLVKGKIYMHNGKFYEFDGKELKEKS